MAELRDEREEIVVGEGITRRAERLAGTACIAGTRIGVVHVLGALRSSQVIVKHVQKYYPTLTGRQINDAIRFAHDEVMRSDDAWIRRERLWAKKLSSVGKKAKKR